MLSVISLSKIAFVEVGADEIIFHKQIPLIWQGHAIIKQYIRAQNIKIFKPIKISLFRIEQKICQYIQNIEVLLLFF